MYREHVRSSRLFLLVPSDFSTKDFKWTKETGDRGHRSSREETTVGILYQNITEWTRKFTVLTTQRVEKKPLTLIRKTTKSIKSVVSYAMNRGTHEVSVETVCRTEDDGLNSQPFTTPFLICWPQRGTGHPSIDNGDGRSVRPAEQRVDSYRIWEGAGVKLIKLIQRNWRVYGMETEMRTKTYKITESFYRVYDGGTPNV